MENLYTHADRLSVKKNCADSSTDDPSLAHVYTQTNYFSLPEFVQADHPSLQYKSAVL